MVGTQKWSMEEILWVITMVRQGMKDEDIYEEFSGIFKNARHARGPSSIKYCRTGFMKQEEYSQEKYWEDAPGKIGFVLGRHDAGVYHGQIAAEVVGHFPAHAWAPHVKPPARCIEFAVTKYRKLQNRFPDYTQDNALVEPVLRLTKDGVSPEDIVKTANENGIGLDDVYYIVARFGLEVKARPTPWEISNYSQYPGASSAGASTSQAGLSNVKQGPLIFQIPPSDTHKKSKVHGPQHSSYPSSDTSSRLPDHRYGYDYINRAGNQVAYHGVQRDLGTSLLNGGYPQGMLSDASSHAQLHLPQDRLQPGLFQTSQQQDMRFSYPHIPQYGQMQHPMAQPRFEQQNFNEYAGEYPNSSIQQSLLGQFQQQNWSNNSALGGQQGVPGQLQNVFRGDQQTVDLFSQRNFGGSSHARMASYQPQPGHHLRQAFTQLPLEILVGEHQQTVLPATGYESIDPALLGMSTIQQSCPDTGIMTHSQPPLTPWIAPQDYLHPFAYSGAQNGQDISPLTIENRQFPVLLPPSPEVTYDGFEQGQSTIPDHFAQDSILSEQPQLGLGTDLHNSSGTNGFGRDAFDQGTFEQALTSASDTANLTTLGDGTSGELVQSMVDIPDQLGNQTTHTEGSSTDQVGQDVDEAIEADDLFKLFLDLEYQDRQGFNFNFNFDGSMIGSGATDPFKNDLSKNSPGAHGSQEMRPFDAKSSLEAMEIVSKKLETEMAGPFLTQSKNLETQMAGPFLTQNLTEQNKNNGSGGIQHSNSGVFEDGYAPDGTCCARHQDVECFFEVSDSESSNFSKR